MRKIIYLTLVFILMCGLCGCHHGSRALSEFVMPEEFDTSKNYELTFWAKNDTNNNQVAVYDKAISDFESLYPNIKIKVKYYNDYNRIYNDVITNIQTNTTPNVCISYPDHVATYKIGTNVVINLEELANDSKYGLGGRELKFDGVKKDEIVSQYYEECKLDGSLYLLPFVRSSEALYINKTYVEKLGYQIPEFITWDFVFEVSKKAMEKNEDGIYKLNGQKTMIPFMYKSTDNMMIQMLKQKGEDISNAGGDNKLFTESTKEILKTISLACESESFNTFKISGYPGNFFNAGQCIFAIDSTAGSTWMGSSAPLSDIDPNSIVEFETVVKPIPQYSKDNIKMISQGPSICVFNKEDSNEVLASWLFAQYLLTNDVQIGYAKTEGYVPVTKKAQNETSYIEYLSKSGETALDSDGKETGTYYPIKIEASKLIMDNTENTFVTYVFNGSTSFREAAGQLIEDTVKNINRGGTTDEEYFKTEFEKINSLYKLDQIKLMK